MTDIKAAAERYRANNYRHDDGKGPCSFSQRQNDIDLLASAHVAYLAERPADGETEIDEAWLLSVGFRKWDGSEDIELYSLYIPMRDELGWPVRLAYESNGFYAVRMCDPDEGRYLTAESVELLGSRNSKPTVTRQRMRDLCRVLGVSLKEGA